MCCQLLLEDPVDWADNVRRRDYALLLLEAARRDASETLPPLSVRRADALTICCAVTCEFA